MNLRTRLRLIDKKSSPIFVQKEETGAGRQNFLALAVWLPYTEFNNYVDFCESLRRGGGDEGGAAGPEGPAGGPPRRSGPPRTPIFLNGEKVKMDVPGSH